MLFSPPTQGHLKEPGSSDHPAPAATASTSEEEQELHYASLSFQRTTSRTFQEQETTEYSEIDPKTETKPENKQASKQVISAHDGECKENKSDLGEYLAMWTQVPLRGSRASSLSS